MTIKKLGKSFVLAALIGGIASYTYYQSSDRKSWQWKTFFTAEKELFEEGRKLRTDAMNAYSGRSARGDAIFVEVSEKMEIRGQDGKHGMMFFGALGIIGLCMLVASKSEEKTPATNG